MLRSLRNLILIVSAVWLTACTKYIETPTVLILPDALTEDCSVVEPLELEAFLKRLRHFQESGIDDPWEAAFLVQSEQWFLQTTEFGLCNLKFRNIREMQSLQK